MDGNLAAGAAVGGVIGIFIAIVIGLVVGAVAKLLMPGSDPGGWVVTCLLGIVGSWVGGWIFALFGIGGGALVGFIGSVLGAMLLLSIYRLVKKNH